ncbi:MAG TPA: hypothetical protein VLQ93_09200 [Myxococcaceae bacterium]|nr:hypothetical protein [Myxococcaceae bacterium]
MAHATKDGLSPLAPGMSPEAEESPTAEQPPRVNQTRTPPRVWPPMSPADMGRMVRRLKVGASRLRDAEALRGLLAAEGTAG